MCTINTDNEIKNKLVAARLKKMLKGSSSWFTKNYLMPCIAHVLNLAIQHGFKEVSNDESYLDSEDDEKHIEGLEAKNPKPFVRFSKNFENLSSQLIIPLR